MPGDLNSVTMHLSKTELVRVKSSDGLFELPMSIIYPTHFDPAKKYPVVINIYGGPNAGTVYDIWNRQFLNAQWWAKEGLIQVSMDNRSSGHFGKKGMNYIFRQLGKYETEDYMDCGRWLRMQTFVDSSKILYIWWKLWRIYDLYGPHLWCRRI